MDDIQVVWRGFIHDAQGYARAAREYILGLDRQGVDVKIEPLNLGTPPVEILVEKAKRLNELINKPLAQDKKKILVYHSQPYGIDPVAERKKGYDKVIVNTVWETDTVPSDWFPSINEVDAVFIPCTHNYEVLKNSGVTVPIFVVPHGADVDMFNPDNEPLPFAEVNDRFKFLSVFQWQHRKAPDVLLKAYWNEFGSTDNVALLVKTYWSNSPTNQDKRAILNHISQFKASLGYDDNNSAPVYFTFSMFSDTHIRAIYTSADAFVLPTRGEGVGLPFIEALSSGIPVIAPRWGGQSDFLNDGNSFPVYYSLVPTTSMVHGGIAPNFGNLFTDNMKWAEPSIDDLARQMRNAYENQGEVKAKGAQGRKDMENMTWDKSGETIKNILSAMVK